MLKLKPLLDDPLQYRIADGVMRFETQSSVSIESGRNFSVRELNVLGKATLIRKPL